MAVYYGRNGSTLSTAAKQMLHRSTSVIRRTGQPRKVCPQISGFIASIRASAEARLALFLSPSKLPRELTDGGAHSHG